MAATQKTNYVETGLTMAENVYTTLKGYVPSFAAKYIPQVESFVANNAAKVANYVKVDADTHKLAQKADEIVDVEKEFLTKTYKETGIVKTFVCAVERYTDVKGRKNAIEEDKIVKQDVRTTARTLIVQRPFEIIDFVYATVVSLIKGAKKTQ
eukprot:Clim_evm11s165 gene=Clim_evmTU11s165